MYLKNTSLQLAQSIAENIYSAIVTAVEDPVGAKISTQLVQHFSEALQIQVQNLHTIQQIQALLCDFLEEVKLNYVKRLAQEDLEQLLAQTSLYRHSCQK